MLFGAPKRLRVHDGLLLGRGGALDVGVFLCDRGTCAFLTGRFTGHVFPCCANTGCDFEGDVVFYLGLFVSRVSIFFGVHQQLWVGQEIACHGTVFDTVFEH